MVAEIARSWTCPSWVGWNEVKEGQWSARRAWGSWAASRRAPPPLARNVPPIDFSRRELPLACRLQGQLGKVPARSGRFKFGAGHIAGGIDMGPYADPHRPPNRVSCFFRHLRHDFFEDFVLKTLDVRRFLAPIHP